MATIYPSANIINASYMGGRLSLPGLWQPGALALTITFLFLFLLGCSSVVSSPGPLAASRGHPSEYRIQPGDQMEIKFFYNPELNELVTVRPDGRVSLQLAQEIKTAGLTPIELTQALKERYARELNRPEIAVIMRTFAGQRIYVDGEVNKPALVPLSAAMTVLQSISSVGGLKDTALSSEVHIIRRSPEGEPRVFTVDLTRVLNGTDLSQDVVLRPFDVVYVPKSTIANINVWVDQYIRKNIPVSFGFFLPVQ
jgi:polysaccharide export outer membrane protein